MHKILIPIILMTSLFLKAQVISTVLQEITLNTNYLLAANKSYMNVTLIKSYTVNESDTSYYISVQIKNQSYEQSGGSLGWSYGLGLNMNTNYQVLKEDGIIIIDKSNYYQIQKCISSSFMTINTNLKNHKSKISASCEREDYSFGIEYTPGGEVQYYFRNGKAIYRLSEEDFKKIMVMFSSAKKHFEGA